MPSPLKTVAIVGRPNVGKSALFNRLAGKTISIVHDQAGVTRDRITAQCRRGPAWFEIMDTGGIGASTDDVLTDQVQIEASIALDVADLLMFVVDVSCPRRRNAGWLGSVPALGDKSTAATQSCLRFSYVGSFVETMRLP